MASERMICDRSLIMRKSRISKLIIYRKIINMMLKSPRKISGNRQVKKYGSILTKLLDDK